MTGPGQRDLVGRAMAEVADGRVHTATVAGGSLGEGRFAVRWEPLDGQGGGAVVIVQRAWPQPAPSWLQEAATRIGSSLDMTETAAEVAEAAVPGFADLVIVYAAERLLAAGELTPDRAAHGAAVRRLTGRKAGQPAGASDQAGTPQRGAGPRPGYPRRPGDGDRGAGPVRPPRRRDRGPARPPPGRPGDGRGLHLLHGHAADRPRRHRRVRDLRPEAGQPRVQPRRHRAGGPARLAGGGVPGQRPAV